MHLCLVDGPADPAAAGSASPWAVATNLPGGVPAGEVLVCPVQPGTSSLALAEQLVRLLVGHWYSAEAACADIFVAGIAGLVAARLHGGPPVEQADAWVRDELAAGRPVTFVSPMEPSSTVRRDGAVDGRAALSFVAFVLEAYGPEALGRFLAAYDPARRDHAAHVAFHQPLGATEAAWQTRLRRAPPRRAVVRSFLTSLLPLLRPHWLRQAEVLVYVLILMTYDRALPLGGKYLVDTVIPGRGLRQLAVFVVALLAVYALDPVVATRRTYVTARINGRILNDLQGQVFGKLQRLPHSFYARTQGGDIALRVSNDMQSISEAVKQTTDGGLYWSLSVVATAFAMLVLKPRLAVAVMVVVPLATAGTLYFSAQFQRLDARLRALTVDALSFLLEHLSAHPVIKAFGLEERVAASYRARLTPLRAVAVRLTVVEALFKESTLLATSIGQVVVLGYGGYLVIERQLTVGTLLAFVGLLPTLFTPVQRLADVNWSILKGAGALRRVLELIHEPASIADRPGALPLPPLASEIRLDHVTAGYGGESPVLRNLSLTIAAGTHIAIVGPSGSGKSTLVNLLVRFWDPEEGRVLVDGHDVRTVTLASLRGQIGLAFPVAFVFDTTARENIAIARPGAADTDIVAAAMAARLHGYITSLPAGYDTILGDHGVRLSGGQQQRLSIARALLRDPRLLILDEATGALDAQTEREVLETLSVFAHGRTLINITHRLAVAALADRVLVLDGGQLVEDGSHAALIEAGGLYQRLYQEQGRFGAEGDAVGVEEARLRAIPLFVSLDDAALAALAALLTRERYPSGADVIRQYEPGNTFYIIARGQVEILVMDAPGPAPTALDDAESAAAATLPRRVAVRNEGEFFGEMALLTGAPRTATVRTTIATELLALTRTDFLALLDRQPGLRRAVAEEAARRQIGLDALANRP